MYTKKAQIPVLTKKLNPSKKVWNKIFTIIQNAGLNFAWLDLMCRPPPSNATNVLMQAENNEKQKELQELTVSSTASSSEKRAVYSYFSDNLTPLQQALFAENAEGKFTTELLSKVEPDVF